MVNTQQSSSSTNPTRTTQSRNQSKKVIVVEDDQDLALLLKYKLELNYEYQVTVVSEGPAALGVILETKPDLIILDRMLPQRDGLLILQDLRHDPTTQSIPVILLTARGQEEDKLAGLQAGADDYVVKPFSPNELLLRMKAILRRTNTSGLISFDEPPAPPTPRYIEDGALWIDKQEIKVCVDNVPIELTGKEFQLLCYLIDHREQLQSRDRLLKAVWGYEGHLNTRTVDTHIKRLRQKLGNIVADKIETVHGFGYRYL